MPKRIVLIAIAVSLSLAGTAQAKQDVLKHPKHQHCKTHYVRKVEHVKKRKHGRLVKITETVCVYVTPKTSAKAVPTTSPVATVPARALQLKAHLDPSFTRNPSNPFAVTYDYSASASFETADLAQVEPAPLPEGILQLFSDGTLACSINVGGATTSGECPVTYPKLGEHTVVTTYTSGSTSATETNAETIEPFTTTTTLTVSAPEECGEETGKENRGFKNGTLHYCSYTITPTVVDQTNTTLTNEPITVTVSNVKGHLAGPAQILSGTTYKVRAEETIYPKQVVEHGMTAPELHECHLHTPFVSVPETQVSSGMTSWTLMVAYGGKTGWTGSASAAETVTP